MSWLVDTCLKGVTTLMGMDGEVLITALIGRYDEDEVDDEGEQGLLSES